MTPIRICFFISLVCSIWNLFGDLCFIDFSIATMDLKGFGTIDSVSRPGNLFDFNRNWSLLLSQAGGWMYPVWAVATIFPLYVGLEPSGRALPPCALLAYGLCVVGGNLHSGYAFATVLPRVFHEDIPKSDEEHGANLLSTINLAQSKVMECYVFGYTPGPLSVFIASIWIMYLVIAKETMFPKWFALFTPVATLALIGLIGLKLIPWPMKMYFLGTFGTWIIFVMNAASSWILWNVRDGITLQIKSENQYETINNSL